MKKYLWKTMIFVVLVMAGGWVAYIWYEGCYLEYAIKKACQDKDNCEIKLSDIYDGKWDLAAVSSSIMDDPQIEDTLETQSERVVAFCETLYFVSEKKIKRKFVLGCLDDRHEIGFKFGELPFIRFGKSDILLEIQRIKEPSLSYDYYEISIKNAVFIP